MNEDAIKQYAKENPKRDVAVLGLRDENGNVLLMRSHKLPELWQPIGGGVDAEDVSPEAAAVRELYEEFGVKINASKLIQILTTPYDFGEGTVYFFEASVVRDDIKLNVDINEVVGYNWFSKEDALTLPAMPATRNYLTLL